jgi:hypothetical protein
MARLCEPVVKSVGKPDAGNRHVRFDERGRETAGCHSVPVQRPSSTLPTECPGDPMRQPRISEEKRFYRTNPIPKTDSPLNEKNTVFAERTQSQKRTLTRSKVDNDFSHMTHSRFSASLLSVECVTDSMESIDYPPLRPLRPLPPLCRRDHAGTPARTGNIASPLPPQPALP